MFSMKSKFSKFSNKGTIKTNRPWGLVKIDIPDMRAAIKSGYLRKKTFSLKSQTSFSLEFLEHLQSLNFSQDQQIIYFRLYMTSNFQPPSINIKAKKEKRTCKKLLAKILGNIRLDEDALKTSWRRLSSSSSEGVFKASSSRRIYSPYSYAFRRRLQDVLKTSWSRAIYSSWSYIFKTPSRRLAKMSSKRLQDVFKTPSRRFQDVPSS